MNRNDTTDSNRAQTRRTFLTAATTVSLVGVTALAGCAGSEEQPDNVAQGEANTDTATRTDTSTQTTTQSETTTTTTTQQNTPSPTQTPTATDSATTTTTTDQEQSGEVEVLSHEFYTGDYGSFGVKGKLKNVSDSTLSYVEVSVKFYDTDGRRVAEGLDNMTDLAAGQTATFDAMGYADVDPATIEEYKLTTKVSSYPSAESTEKRVKVLSHEFYTGDYGSFGVKGTLKNVSGETLDYVEVAVVFYDGAGTRVAEGLDNMTDLSVGTEATFDAMGYASGDFSPEDIADYKLTTDTSVY